MRCDSVAVSWLFIRFSTVVAEFSQCHGKMLARDAENVSWDEETLKLIPVPIIKKN